MACRFFTNGATREGPWSYRVRNLILSVAKWGRSVVSDPMDGGLPGSRPMRFSRQEYWSGLPFPSPGDLPNPGIKPESPALQTDALPSELLRYLWLDVKSEQQRIDWLRDLFHTRFHQCFEPMKMLFSKNQEIKVPIVTQATKSKHDGDCRLEP